MTAKTSISLTDSQEAFARRLVENGTYSSLSAVVQHGIEMLRTEREKHEAEIAALRGLLEERRRGKSISMAEGRKRTERMIAAKKAALRKAKS
jgi:antitoxin ParD1/3/4